jgi:hypothetical protein
VSDEGRAIDNRPLVLQLSQERPQHGCNQPVSGSNLVATNKQLNGTSPSDRICELGEMDFSARGVGRQQTNSRGRAAHPANVIGRQAQAFRQ